IATKFWGLRRATLLSGRLSAGHKKTAWPTHDNGNQAKSGAWSLNWVDRLRRLRLSGGHHAIGQWREHSADSPKRALSNVRLWHKADIPPVLINVRFRG